jgi:hypothetical protein
MVWFAQKMANNNPDVYPPGIIAVRPRTPVPPQSHQKRSSKQQQQQQQETTE